MSATRSTRNAAFARRPRGGENSLSGEPSPRITTRINGRFLERMRNAAPDPDLKTIMTKVNANLTIEVGPQGGLNYNLTRQGQILADNNDIVRIQGLNAQVTKERKEALKEDSVASNRAVIAAMVTVGNRPEVLRPLVRIPANWLDAYRPINQQLGVLSKNINSIESLEVTAGSTHATIRNLVLEFGRRIRVAVGEYLFHRAEVLDGTTPFKLNHFLREKNVPLWIFHKLTVALIQINQSGFDVRTIFFPADPTKGLVLTFREIVGTEMISNLGGLLDGADLLLALFENEMSLIKKLINVAPDTDLVSFDKVNSFASKIANTPFFVPPPPGMIDTQVIFNFLNKNGVRGVQWQSGTVFSPQDNLKFVGTLAKRMAYGLLPQPTRRAGRYSEIFPGFVFTASVDAENIFAQIKSWSLVPGRDMSWFRIGARDNWTDENKPLIQKVFADVLGVDSENELATDFVANIDATDWIGAVHGEGNSDTDLFTQVKNTVVQLRAANNPGHITATIGTRFTGAGLEVKASKKKTGPRAGTVERTAVTPAVIDLLETMRKANYSTLANRMDGWFRQFLTGEVQTAVADLFSARLAGFLAVPLDVSREERLAFLEPDDFDVGTNEEETGADDEGQAPVNNPDDI